MMSQRAPCSVMMQPMFPLGASKPLKAAASDAERTVSASANALASRRLARRALTPRGALVTEGVYPDQLQPQIGTNSTRVGPVSRSPAGDRGT